MGLTRLVLSLLVVGSHFGNLGEPIGGTAVASFFTISGFLMARTIRENYAGASGVGRFYSNRIVRIMPPFLAVLLLTALVLTVRGMHPFALNRWGAVGFPDVEFAPAWWQTVLLDLDPYPRYLSAQVYLAPQAWSLVVEAVFYLLAPALVALATARLRAGLWIIGVASLSLALLSVPEAGNGWIRSPIDSVWVFVVGVLAYEAAARLGPRVERRWIARAAVLLIVAIALRFVVLPERAALFVAPLLAAAWLALGGWAVRRGAPLDRTLGNLAYGVFIGHFLSALLLMWANESLYHATGRFVFGENDYSTVSEHLFRSSFYVAALLGGAAIYYGVERPFERLRARLRQPRPAPAATPAPSLVPYPLE
jgi:peptidoglycan/LPS O-acetylase OafA/YrhL